MQGVLERNNLLSGYVIKLDIIILDDDEKVWPKQFEMLVWKYKSTREGDGLGWAFFHSFGENGGFWGFFLTALMLTQ